MKNPLRYDLSKKKTDSNICPHKSLMQYLSIRKHDSPSQPLFSFMDGVPVSRQFFTELRLPQSFSNLNLHQYQTHSFGIGVATTTAARFLLQNFKSNTLGDGSQMCLESIFTFKPYNYETSTVSDSEHLSSVTG